MVFRKKEPKRHDYVLYKIKDKDDERDKECFSIYVEIGKWSYLGSSVIKRRNTEDIAYSLIKRGYTLNKKLDTVTTIPKISITNSSFGSGRKINFPASLQDILEFEDKFTKVSEEKNLRENDVRLGGCAPL